MQYALIAPRPRRTRKKKHGQPRTESPITHRNNLARISIELGSRGTIHLTTLPAIAIEEFIQSVKKK